MISFGIVRRGSGHVASQIGRSVLEPVSRTPVTVSVSVVGRKAVAPERSGDFAHYGPVASVVFSVSSPPPNVGIFGLPSRIAQGTGFSCRRSSRPTVGTAQGQRPIGPGFRFCFGRASRLFLFGSLFVFVLIIGFLFLFLLCDGIRFRLDGFSGACFLRAFHVEVSIGFRIRGRHFVCGPFADRRAFRFRSSRSRFGFGFGTVRAFRSSTARSGFSTAAAASTSGPAATATSTTAPAPAPAFASAAAGPTARAGSPSGARRRARPRTGVGPSAGPTPRSAQYLPAHDSFARARSRSRPRPTIAIILVPVISFREFVEISAGKKKILLYETPITE